MPVVADADIGRKPMPWRATPQVAEFLQGGTRCPQCVGSCGSAVWFFPFKRSSCAWRRTFIVLRTRRSTLIHRPPSFVTNAATPQRRRRESRPGSHGKFVLSWRVKTGQYQPASSSLGVSRELHFTLFPQGQSQPGLASQKLKCNYENEQQN